MSEEKLIEVKRNLEAVIEILSGVDNNSKLDLTKDKLEDILHGTLEGIEVNKEKEDRTKDLPIYFETPNSHPTKVNEESIVVYWSGGCDSTALLFWLANKFPERSIKAVSFNMENVMNSKADKYAREELKLRFRQLGIDNIWFTESDASLSYVGNNGGLGQPPMWLSFLPTVISTDSSVMFGYIKGDDIWHFINPFKRVFYGLCEIMQSNSKCYFPLEFVDKKGVVRYLKKYDLLQYCNWCENRQLGSKLEEPCGTCPSCKKMQAVEYFIGKEDKEREVHAL